MRQAETRAVTMPLLHVLSKRVARQLSHRRHQQRLPSSVLKWAIRRCSSLVPRVHLPHRVPGSVGIAPLPDRTRRDVQEGLRYCFCGRPRWHRQVPQPGLYRTLTARQLGHPVNPAHQSIAATRPQRSHTPDSRGCIQPVGGHGRYTRLGGTTWTRCQSKWMRSGWPLGWRIRRSKEPAIYATTRSLQLPNQRVRYQHQLRPYGWQQQQMMRVAGLFRVCLLVHVEV
mmetsp:Transcript_22326/g.50401  ORF Transcript_22326/g.50401 Transcript_22326/m.50401 type:complete len:227 (-) Transcript_22326:1950-2630(-)